MQRWIYNSIIIITLYLTPVLININYIDMSERNSNLEGLSLLQEKFPAQIINLTASPCNFPAISSAVRASVLLSFQNRENQNCREFHKRPQPLQLQSSID